MFSPNYWFFLAARLCVSMALSGKDVTISVSCSLAAFVNTLYFNSDDFVNAKLVAKYWEGARSSQCQRCQPYFLLVVEELLCFVLGIEAFGVSWRVFSLTVGWIAFSLGYIIMAGIAYLETRWRYFLIWTTVPDILVFFAYLL